MTRPTSESYYSQKKIDASYYCSFFNVQWVGGSTKIPTLAKMRVPGYVQKQTLLILSSIKKTFFQNLKYNFGMYQTNDNTCTEVCFTLSIGLLL